MEEQIVDEKVPSSIRTPEVKTSAVDFETGLKHIIGPAVIGMTLGMSAEVFLTPNYAWPSPPQAAIIGAILFYSTER